MNDSQNNSGEPFKELRQNVSMAIGLSQALAMPARIWWMRLGTAGEMFFGGRLCVVGWVMMPIWTMFFAPHDPRPMFAFWGLTTLLLLAHRVRHTWLQRSGYRPHSQSGGRSRLEFLGGNAAAKRFWEPLLTAVCGGACLDWNRPLGMYLVWAGIAMAVSAAYAFAMDESMSRRLRDARCEQEWLAEKMQEDDVG